MNDTPENAESKVVQPSEPPPYRMIAQYVKDLSFENLEHEDIFLRNPSKTGRVNTRADTSIRSIDGMNNHFESDIYILVEAGNDDDVVYRLECNYAGLVEFTRQVSQDHATALLLVDIPQLMYPFLRQIVANQTVLGGYPPVYLGGIDFAGLYIKKRTQAMNSGEDTGG